MPRWYADPDVGLAPPGTYRHPRHYATVTAGPPPTNPPPPPRIRLRPRWARPGLPVDHAGPRLYRWRARAGLTQRQVGELLGVTAGQVSRWERGLDRIPRRYLEQLGTAGRTDLED